MKQKRKIYIVAGESSGDELGAELIDALRELSNAPIDVLGIGGPLMATKGVKSPINIKQLSILGIFEGLKHYRKIVKLSDIACENIVKEKPDIVIFIDSWGFTQRVSDRLRKKKVSFPLVKYVGPQIWATRPGRAKKISNNYDMLLSINLMDRPYYEELPIEVEDVGNPIVTRSSLIYSQAAARDALNYSKDDIVFCLAAGSRKSEISQLLSVFKATIEDLSKLYADRLKFVTPIAQSVHDEVEKHLQTWPVKLKIVKPEEKFIAFAASDLALAASGTVTTQIAMAQTPVVIAYKFHPLTYKIVEKIAITDFAALINVTAGTAIAPEFIQDQCDRDNLVKICDFLLSNKQARQAQVAAQNASLGLMGRGDRNTNIRAAKAILKKMNMRAA